MSSSIITSTNRSLYLDPGPLRALVEEFGRCLASQGHTVLTVRGYEDAARHFAAWFQQTRTAVADIGEDTCAAFAAHPCRCPGGRRVKGVSAKYARRARRFVQFLSTSGVVGPTTTPEPAPVAPRVGLFQDWLRRHRGISERTIDRYGRMVMRLLAALGADPAGYEAGLIRQAILDEVKDMSAAHAKTITTALRCYLRFLGSSGECRTDLVHAVPTIPQWRLSAMPRYLPLDDVERLIASCDTSLARGVRDRAILLLLSRLGLRAGDVIALRLDHVCWTDGTLRVGGKGRRDVCLPLPQEAGDALLDYICRARPTSDSDVVFLRSCAPYRPFAVSSSISSVVKQALARAGISNPPSYGANLLRHSAATSMLRAGATLDTIGTVLRHRSATTTAHYAKVDIPMLLQVAQPWTEHCHAE
jgi:site-specific recombinase XerD